MTAAGTVLLLGLMAATLIVLVIGIFLMGRGGEANRKYSNKLMTMRVVLQGCALAVVAALLYFTKK